MEKAIDQIQYYLYREYVQMKINLYYEDFSTSYREGGWSDRAVLKKINKRSEAIYQQRFNDAQKTNLRYPFKPNDLSHFDDTGTKDYTLKDIYDMSNDLLGATSNWSDKKPLFHMNKHEWENNNIQLIQAADNKQAYFNGLDRGHHLGELELSVWEAENLLNDYRITFLDPILTDLNLPKFSSDGSINEDNLVTLREFIKNEDLKKFYQNRKHLSSYQFAGYHYQWTQIFFEKVVLPIWNVNKKVMYNQNQKFADVLKRYTQDKNDGKLTNPNLISPEFNITDELKDRNDNYIIHPDYPIELGALKISQFNFYNQAYFMVGRDYQILSMGFEPLSNDRSINQNRIATNIDNPFWNDVSLLKAFDALPYDNTGNLVDDKLLEILAKIMRIDQDIAMTYKSQISGFSYLWGYMPENADYNALVFKSGSVVKKMPIYQAKYNISGSDEKTIDFDHTFYLKNFMNRTSKDLLTKLMKRKAWITDWNLIDDFENAVLPTGNYTVSFEDKDGNLVPVKGYDDFPKSSTLTQWKLNPWGDYDVFSGFQFYYDAVSQAVKLKVNSRSWVG